MSVTCTRRLQWCMGHRVMGHEGKCGYPHGHNYVGLFTAKMKPAVFKFTDRGGQAVYSLPTGREIRVDPEVELTPEYLDSLGMVVDFAVLKAKIGGWIEENWDHGFVLAQGDGAMIEALNAFYRSGGKPAKVFYLEDNPTAENLATYLLTEVCPLVLKDTAVQVEKVTIWETENCEATALSII